MNKRIRRLRAYVQMHLPYRTYKWLSLIFFFVFIIGTIIAILLSFVKVSSIPYDEMNRNDYMYLRIIHAYSTVDHYYFLEDEDYIYLYYDDENIDVYRLKQVEGVPMEVDYQILEKMLDDFQDYFPYLEVTSVEEMVEYTGFYALDATVPPLILQSGLTMIVALLCLFISLYLLFILKIYSFIYRSSLKCIVTHQEQEKVIQQLTHPLYKFTSIKVAMLDNYLVFNHPSPFVIKYEDITWIYIHKRFLSTELRIILYDKNFKKHKVLYTMSVIRKNKEEIIELFDVLPIIHPELLVGYNNENKIKFKQLKQGILLQE